MDVPEGYISSEDTEENKLVPDGDRFNMPDQTLWKRLATINTTVTYQRSFKLLWEDVKELATGKKIPPLFMFKKFIYYLKVTQVRYLVNCKEIEHILFYDEDGDINKEEKSNSVYLPSNRVIFLC